MDSGTGAAGWLGQWGLYPQASAGAGGTCHHWISCLESTQYSVVSGWWLMDW